LLTWSTLAAKAAAELGDPASVEIGSGGSIPLIDVLREEFPDAEILLFGAQDPAARIHAPNESVDLNELHRAVLAEALFIAELAADVVA
jgi:cysteinylglycine-S-conjugate dipeptidase